MGPLLERAFFSQSMLIEMSHLAGHSQAVITDRSDTTDMPCLTECHTYLKSRDVLRLSKFGLGIKNRLLAFNARRIIFGTVVAAFCLDHVRRITYTTWRDFGSLLTTTLEMRSGQDESQYLSKKPTCGYLSFPRDKNQVWGGGSHDYSTD